MSNPIKDQNVIAIILITILIIFILIFISVPGQKYPNDSLQWKDSISANNQQI